LLHVEIRVAGVIAVQDAIDGLTERFGIYTVEFRVYACVSVGDIVKDFFVFVCPGRQECEIGERVQGVKELCR
jgi:hypothetical protein